VRKERGGGTLQKNQKGARLRRVLLHQGRTPVPKTEDEEKRVHSLHEGRITASGKLPSLSRREGREIAQRHTAKRASNRKKSSGPKTSLCPRRRKGEREEAKWAGQKKGGSIIEQITKKEGKPPDQSSKNAVKKRERRKCRQSSRKKKPLASP